MTFRTLFWGLGLAFLAGCAVTVDVPVNRFDTPETTGKQWRVKLQGNYGGTDSVVLTPDATVSAPNTTHPTFDSSRFGRFDAGVGIIDNLDVELRTSGDIEAVVKYQFLGEPHLTAQPGNFAMAMTAIGGGGNYSSTPTSLSSSTRVTQTEYFFDLALLAGYRVAEPVLFYGGPFMRQTWFKGTWTQTDPNTSAQIALAPYSGTVLSTGANIGLEVGNPLVQFKVEGAYANVKSGSVNTGRFFGGLALAFQFGAH